MNIMSTHRKLKNNETNAYIDVALSVEELLLSFERGEEWENQYSETPANLLKQ